MKTKFEENRTTCSAFFRNNMEFILYWNTYSGPLESSFGGFDKTVTGFTGRFVFTTSVGAAMAA